MNYTINFSSGTVNTIPANCTGSVCKNMVEVHPPTVCQSSKDNSTISVSAVNRLGPGQPSVQVSVGQCVCNHLHTVATKGFIVEFLATG